MEQLVTVPTPNGNTELCIETFGEATDPPAIQVEGHLAQLISTPRSFCEKLAARGFYVVRFDNRDVGRSQRFPGVDYTLADMAKDVHGLLTVLDAAPAFVCGRSMGGMIAQLLALAYPEDVAGLGLFFTASRSHDDSLGPATEPWVPFEDEADFVAWEQLSLPETAGSRFPISAATIDLLARTMWSRGIDTAGFDRQARAMATTPAWADRLDRVSAPVVVVHGDEDAIIPVYHGRELADLLTDVTLTVVPGMGHQQPPELDDLFVESVVDLRRRSG